MYRLMMIIQAHFGHLKFLETRSGVWNNQILEENKYCNWLEHTIYILNA